MVTVWEVLAVPSPFRQRRSFFKGVVQGAALSGLETATGVRGSSPIDRLLVKYGRVFLRSTAKVNEGGVRALPNVIIWRRLRLVPTFYELRYRRVAWAQRLSENLEEHDAVLTGLMGQFAFENRSTVMVDGSLNESAIPWVQQLLADVMAILFFASDLREEWDRPVLSLFGKHAESFRKIDLNEARATHWSVEISAGARKKAAKMWKTSSIPSSVSFVWTHLCDLERAHFAPTTTFGGNPRYSTRGLDSHRHQRVCTMRHDMQEQVGSERSPQARDQTSARRTRHDARARLPRTRHFVRLSCMRPWLWLSD